ncbi:CHAP domain-containing protein [Hyalangium versicolor]|uniref:CHAP domain-containing protein n=1 Tax=Hyalangium versicolor TaxID=2861190 RepID=UPI001CCA3537|nr:CHAP domain-containing protein [Hyalangium versicolor]
MEQNKAGETLGSVQDLASAQDESPADDFGPDELIDSSQEAPPPPSDNGLREGDEDLAGPSNQDLAFNDDDLDDDPVALDAAQSDGTGELEVAQQMGKDGASAAKAMKVTLAPSDQLSRFLRAAQSQIGYRSRPGNPPFSKYGRWLGFPNGGQGHYCAAFVSWCAAKAGISQKVGKSGWVKFFLDAYKRRGRFGSTPRVGSLVIFDFERDGVVDHIGIVTEVGRNYIRTIEGNTGDPRGVRDRKRIGPSIRGYCYPSFTDKVNQPQPPTPAQHVWHTVRKGETLTKISKQYGVSIALLLKRNKGQAGQGKITNPNQIFVNQRILIR